jgi:sulfoxide reductase heme-binding subunit YedZ
MALVTLTVNFLLGLLLVTAYRKTRLYKRLPAWAGKIDVNAVHNWTAYIVLALIILHPFLLLWDRATKFTVVNLLAPFWGPHQAFWTGMGGLAFYAIWLVIITSQKKVKQRMGFRFWKNVHLVSYGTALLACLHGIVMDPQLKDRQPDFFDGEKLLCELCLVMLLLVALLRWNYYRKKQPGLGDKVRDATDGAF